MLINFYTKLYHLSSKHSRIIFGAILAWGLLLRLIYWYMNQTGGRDELYYISKAIGGSQLQQVAAFPGVHPPLPEAYLEALFRLFPGADNIQKLVIARLSVLWIGVLGIIPFYFIGKILFRRCCYAFLLMFFAAIQPSLVEYSVTFLREAFSVPLSAFVLLLLLENVERPSAWKMGLLGGAIGLTTLCRYEMLEWLVYCFFIFACPLFTKQKKWHYRFYHLGILTGIFLIFYLFMPILLGQTWNSQLKFVGIILKRILC